MFGSTSIILEIVCCKKLANKDQIIESGLSGRYLVYVLLNKVNNVYDLFEDIP